VKGKKSGAAVTVFIVLVIIAVAAVIAFHFGKDYLSAKGLLDWMPPWLANIAFPQEAAQTTAQSGGGRNAAAVRAARVELGTIENTVTLGAEALADSQVPVFPEIAGKITRILVKTGDRVRARQSIAMVDPSRPGDPFRASPVTTTVAGTVLSVPAAVGDTVQTGTVIAEVGDISRLKLEAFVPERYSVNMKIGLAGQVRFEAIPDEVFSAVIYEMSPVIDQVTRTRRILLRFTGAVDPRVLAGMFSTLNLVTNSQVDVPVIPRSCLINTYGKWIVFVVEDNKARRVEVETGLESEDLVEITGGLETGDLVVTEGQTFLSDGDAVRILD